MSDDLDPVVELADDELDLANAVYAELAFQPSLPGRGRVYAVLEGGAPVALGRLQVHDGGSLELGGYWVREDRRGRGLARRMVEATLAAAPEGADLWLVAFDHLTDFYRRFGLVDVARDDARVPPDVRAKVAFCGARAEEGTYHPTDLLLRPGAR